MKFVVQDIRDIKDSREILESKPHPFTAIFIYIILTLISSALIWSWFSEKEIVVKASGTVRPNKEVYKIPNMIASKIESINFKNGQEVKKDDVLYTLDHNEWDLQKKSLQEKINDLNQDIDNLDKLKKCILDDKNYFDENNDKEKDYYIKYINYEKSNKVSLADSNSITDSKHNLNSKIYLLNLLQKSINEDKNYLQQNTSYYEQYNNYNISQKQITDKISEIQKLYDSLQNNKYADKNQIEKVKIDLNTYKGELEKLKSDYNLKISSNIEEIRGKIQELDNNLNKANDTNNLNKEKNKSTVLVQIDDGIKANKNKLKELEENLKLTDINIDKCTVRALNDGILDIQTDLKVGDVVQAGSIVATILPNESNYKINLFISNKDIANIKEGQTVKYSFAALPYKEYGFLNGNVEEISVDSKVNRNTGISFYTAESSINKSKVFSHKGEESQIKNGMTCEAQIVTRKEKMLYYLLEKLNLKD